MANNLSGPVNANSAAASCRPFDLDDAIQALAQGWGLDEAIQKLAELYAFASKVRSDTEAGDSPKSSLEMLKDMITESDRQMVDRTDAGRDYSIFAKGT
jgi:hypothetical protein